MSNKWERKASRRRNCPVSTQPYTIRAGDTVFALARRFDTSVAAIVSANPFIEPENLQIGQMICIPRDPDFPPCPEENYYTIRSGDTFFSIARRYNISVDDLIEANPLVDPDRLRVGQIICIPVATPPSDCPSGSRTYTIRRGDTFFAIAQRLNTTVDRLIRLNPDVDPDNLLIGQTICVPN